MISSIHLTKVMLTSNQVGFYLLITQSKNKGFSTTETNEIIYLKTSLFANKKPFLYKSNSQQTAPVMIPPTNLAKSSQPQLYHKLGFFFHHAIKIPVLLQKGAA